MNQVKNIEIKGITICASSAERSSSSVHDVLSHISGFEVLLTVSVVFRVVAAVARLASAADSLSTTLVVGVVVVVVVVVEIFSPFYKIKSKGQLFNVFFLS